MAMYGFWKRSPGQNRPSERKRSLDRSTDIIRFYASLGGALAVLWSAFQLYTAGFGFFHVMIQRPIHAGFAVALTFLTFPLGKRWIKDKFRLLDFILFVGTCVAIAYLLFNFERINGRMEFVEPVYASDVIFCLVLILVTLEACRRVAGIFLSVVAFVFIVYGFIGPYLPGMLYYSGMSLKTFTDLQFLTDGGLFGIPTGVSAEVVFYFVLFAAFLQESGGGQFFIDLATRLTGRMKGGPAKAAVVASSLMGTINGSAVANVVSTGVFTIPLMKRIGYSPRFAAAVESVASTGGQLMPPIMGAGAFVMADITGIPYLKIVVAAAIPAVLYYLSLFLMVDFQARKLGLREVSREDMPSNTAILSRIQLIIPLLILVYVMVTGFTVTMGAFLATLSTVFISWFKKDTRITPRRFVKALENGGKRAIAVAIPCAAASVIVGMIIYTGLGLKLTSVIILLSGGKLLPALLLVMVACIILGMGMPTTSAYIMTSVLMAPALQELGLAAIVAHLFIFYFSILSMITPPVAVAAFAAAGIAESDSMKTGIDAFRLSFAAFLIPFAFAYNPALILQGPLLDTTWTAFTCVIGVAALASVMVGHFLFPLPFFARLLLFASSITLILPEKLTDLIGFLIVSSVLFLLWIRRNHAAVVVESRKPNG
jgi:TRAP transporter 4TM/12TM fusion protein